MILTNFKFNKIALFSDKTLPIKIWRPNFDLSDLILQSIARVGDQDRILSTYTVVNSMALFEVQSNLIITIGKLTPYAVFIWLRLPQVTVGSKHKKHHHYISNQLKLHWKKKPER